MQGAGEKWNSPSSPCFARSFPPRGSLDVRQGFTFLPKKMKFTEFFFRQGEAAKSLTIFAEKNEDTEFFFRQGEDMQRPLQSAEADSFPDGEAENAG